MRSPSALNIRLKRRTLSHLALLLILIFCAGFPVANADIPANLVTLHPDSEHLVLSSHLIYRAEGPSDSNLEELLSNRENQWVPVRSEIANLGYTATPHWFAVDLQQSNGAGDWYLTIPYPVLDYVDIYLLRQEKVESFKLGERLPFSTRPVNHKDFVVPLSFNAGEQVRVLVRVQTESSLQLPLSLWRKISFHERNAAIHLAQGMYFGLLAVMALYNLFLYLSIREKRFALYVGFIVSFLMYQLCFSGYGYQYLWPHMPSWNDSALPLFLSLVLFFLALFVREFLDLPTHYPSSARFYEFCAGFVFLLGMSSSFLPYSTTAVGLIALSIPMTGYAIILGIKRSMEGVTTAMYFSIAWMMTLTGAICLALNKLGVLPRNVFTEHSLQIGTAIEVVLISFALGSYINQQRSAKFVAQAEALRLEKVARQAQEQTLLQQQELNASLEMRVRERTQDLQAAMAELSLANRRLKDMSQIDDLTQLYNRRYFNSSYLNEYQRSSRTGEPLSLILVDVDFFKRVNDTYGHLVGDDCLVYLARVLQQFARRPADVVARFGGEEFILMLPNTDAQGAYQIAEALRQEVGKGSVKVPGADTEIRLAVSAGYVTLIANPQVSPEAVIAAADDALYQAKATGRNRVCQGKLAA